MGLSPLSSDHRSFTTAEPSSGTLTPGTYENAALVLNSAKTAMETEDLEIPIPKLVVEA